MAEADKETAKQEATSPEPDLIEGDPEEEGDGMVIAMSRGVGFAARSMSDGLQTVVDLFRPRRERPVARPADKPEELIAALAELVAASGESYQDLENQEDFWELIARLYKVHRRKRVQRQPDEPPKRKLRKKKVKAKAEAEEEPKEEPKKEPAKPARSKKGGTTETAKAEKKKKEKAPKPKAEEEFEDISVGDGAEEDTE